MIRLILVRHGNTFEENQVPVQIGAGTDLPLTAHGRAQAEKMAQYLISEKIQPKAIYAGGLKRQTEFAKIICGNFDLLFFSEPALTEIDYGAWEGLSLQQIGNLWPKEYTEWNEEGKWPEHLFRGTFQRHIDGVEAWLQFLRKKYASNDTVVAVSSNGLLRFFQSEKKLKVKTGHFCELYLFQDRLEINRWNVNP